MVQRPGPEGSVPHDFNILNPLTLQRVDAFNDLHGPNGKRKVIEFNYVPGVVALGHPGKRTSEMGKAEDLKREGKLFNLVNNVPLVGPQRWILGPEVKELG